MPTVSRRPHPLWYAALLLFFAAIGAVWIYDAPAWLALPVWAVGAVCGAYAVRAERRRA